MSRLVGPLFQNGYVVRDWRSAADHWSRLLGVGPFFAMEHVAFADCRYRGAPSAIDMSVALAYSGDLQIELIEQHNEAPSIYRDFSAVHGEGLQHLGVLVDRLDDALALEGWADRVVQAGATTVGQRFAYVDVGCHPGGMIELIEATEAARGAFAYMKEKAAQWNGDRPIRVSK